MPSLSTCSGAPASVVRLPVRSDSDRLCRHQTVHSSQRMEDTRIHEIVEAIHQKQLKLVNMVSGWKRDRD